MDTTVKEPPVKRQRTSDDSSDDEITDSFCDPNNPRVLTFQDVSAAAYKVKAGIQHTPCTVSHLRRLDTLASKASLSEMFLPTLSIGVYSKLKEFSS